MRNRRLSKKTFIVARRIKPKRCFLCGKMIREENESLLCGYCYHEEMGRQRRFKNHG